MSRPAVGNAVARLKVMFNDDELLFDMDERNSADCPCISVIWFSPSGTLQLVPNELPGSGFEPTSSERVFNLCVCSPLDNILTSQIYNRVEKLRQIFMSFFKASLNQNTEHQRYAIGNQFVSSYEEFRRPEFYQRTAI